MWVLILLLASGSSITVPIGGTGDQRACMKQGLAATKYINQSDEDLKVVDFECMVQA